MLLGRGTSGHGEDGSVLELVGILGLVVAVGTLDLDGASVADLVLELIPVGRERTLDRTGLVGEDKAPVGCAESALGSGSGQDILCVGVLPVDEVLHRRCGSLRKRFAFLDGDDGTVLHLVRSLLLVVVVLAHDLDLAAVLELAGKFVEVGREGARNGAGSVVEVESDVGGVGYSGDCALKDVVGLGVLPLEEFGAGDLLCIIRTGLALRSVLAHGDHRIGQADGEFHCGVTVVAVICESGDLDGLGIIGALSGRWGDCKPFLFRFSGVGYHSVPVSGGSDGNAGRGNAGLEFHGGFVGEYAGRTKLRFLLLAGSQCDKRKSGENQILDFHIHSLSF